MTSAKLYHNNVLIGTISNVAPEDMFEMSGDIELTAEGTPYRKIFSFLTDEEAMTSGCELPFDESYLDHWSIEDENGHRTEIMTPGVYENGEIIWRE